MASTFKPDILSKALSPRAIEWLSGAVMMLVGSFFSPTWLLMSWVMKPYVDLQTFFLGHDLVAAYVDLIFKLKTAGPAHLFFVILPLLLLSVAVGAVYYSACTWLGVKIAKKWFTKPDLKATAS